MREIVLGLVAAALAGCAGNDEGARYLQRKDTVTLSAGDASRANITAQTLHPWPPGVGDRNIPMQGVRAASAMKNYRCGNVDNRGPVQTNSQTQTQPTAGGGTVSQTTTETGRAKADKTSDC